MKCDSKAADKSAPFQKMDKDGIYRIAGRISWDAHVEAHKQWRYGQTSEGIARRGGFGDYELDELYPEWRKYIIAEYQL